MSPRWFDGTDHLALDTGGGPIARLWSTALSGLVDTGYVQATGHSVKITLPRTVLKPEAAFEWNIPQWSNALERNRARTYFQAYVAALALHFVEKALEEVRGGRTETWTPFEVPDEAVSVGFTEAVRGVLSPPHGDPGGQDRELPPVPADAVERQRARHLRHPGPYEDAVQNTPIFEENSARQLQGHRHHAGRAQLRPVPAVRRPHVHRPRRRGPAAALAGHGGPALLTGPPP